MTWFWLQYAICLAYAEAEAVVKHSVSAAAVGHKIEGLCKLHRRIVFNCQITTDHNEDTPIRCWLAVTGNQLVIHYGRQLLQFLDNLGCPSELLSLVG